MWCEPRQSLFREVREQHTIRQGITVFRHIRNGPVRAPYITPVHILDFHNHLIPGVDDGAATIAESRAALAEMQAQGILTVITTPHIRASLLERPAELEQYLDGVDAGWMELSGLAAAEFPEMRLERGFEVMLDIPRPDLSDPRLRLAGSRFVLVEFPFFTIPLNSAQAIFDLKMAGHTPVVAHPERYTNVMGEWGRVAEWRRAGGLIQMNAGSLTGQYGDRARKVAWMLLEHGWADYLSSDYHARGECNTATACELLTEHGGAAQVDLMAVTNPAGIIAGDDPTPVPPLRKQSRPWWRIGRGQ